MTVVKEAKVNKKIKSWFKEAHNLEGRGMEGIESRKDYSERNRGDEKKKRNKKVKIRKKKFGTDWKERKKRCKRRKKKVGK